MAVLSRLGTGRRRRSGRELRVEKKAWPSVYEPGFSSIWGALLAIVVAYAFSSMFLLAWIALSGEKVSATSLTAGDLVSSSLGTWLGFFGAAWMASRRLGTGSLRRDYSAYIRLPVDIPVGVIAGLVLQFAILPIVYLPLEPLIPDLQKKLSGPATYITSAGRGWTVVLVGLVIVVGAPIVEEVFFRGLLLQSISYKLRNLRKWRANILAVLLSAIGFGLAHVEPLQLLGLVAVGIVLGALRIYYKRLGPGMVAHATFNLVTFIALVRH